MINFRSNFYVLIFIGLLLCNLHSLKSDENNEKCIVFLKGNSSSGKSSIAKEIQLINSTWKVVSEDALFFEQFPRYWEELFPQEFESILKVIDRSNLVHAIMRDQIYFTHNVSVEDKTAALEAINKIRDILNIENEISLKFKATCTERFQNFIFNQINEHLLNGFNVIVDSSNSLKQEKIDKLSGNNKVITTLVYCPLEIAIYRVMERNDSANRNEDFISLRFYHQVINNFLGSYDLISTSEMVDENRFVDKISLEKIHSIFDFIGLNMVESSHAVGFTFFSWGEFDKCELEKTKKIFLFKFDAEKECNIIPKIKHDILIRTDKHSSKESANLILRNI